MERKSLLSGGYKGLAMVIKVMEGFPFRNPMFLLKILRLLFCCKKGNLALALWGTLTMTTKVCLFLVLKFKEDLNNYLKTELRAFFLPLSFG